MSSKFSSIFAARKSEETEAVEETAPPSPALAEKHEKSAPSKKAKQVTETVKRLGRPLGKRSDGDHVQVTAYIRRETHKAVKITLLRADSGQEFSELVEELLSKWLKSRT
jgi:hypothetical protein